ncbi:hypothetical protein K431DRAFT_7871 [Polychaeton citri CBS 116435]|uniref:Uncharacterized protein n=1 Tax=Polychaeton citri CBS 116435 TaxID=1314669 RepID=A0A9P4QFA5_9PEZI|nr:hypothetical protein K431DRAFT_7871 [Polychaeton citri CBS 116435]
MCQYHRNTFTCGHSGRLIFRADPTHKQACSATDTQPLAIKDYKYPYQCNNCKETSRKQAEEEKLKLQAMKSDSKAERRLSGRPILGRASKSYTGTSNGTGTGTGVKSDDALSPVSTGERGLDEIRKSWKRTSAGSAGSGSSSGRSSSRPVSREEAQDRGFVESRSKLGRSAALDGASEGGEPVKDDATPGTPTKAGGKHKPKQLSTDSGKDCVVQ